MALKRALRSTAPTGVWLEINPRRVRDGEIETVTALLHPQLQTAPGGEGRGDFCQDAALRSRATSAWPA
jgi:hypothetical protein